MAAERRAHGRGAARSWPRSGALIAAAHRHEAVRSSLRSIAAESPAHRHRAARSSLQSRTLIPVVRGATRSLLCGCLIPSYPQSVTPKGRCLLLETRLCRVYIYSSTVRCYWRCPNATGVVPPRTLRVAVRQFTQPLMEHPIIISLCRLDLRRGSAERLSAEREKICHVDVITEMQLALLKTSKIF